MFEEALELRQPVKPDPFLKTYAWAPSLAKTK